MAVVSRFQGQLWADFLVLPIGLFSLGLFGWGIKRQTPARWYFDRQQPFYIRNLPFMRDNAQS